MKRWLLRTGLGFLAVGLVFSFTGRFLGGDTELEAQIFGRPVNVRCLPLFANELVISQAGDEPDHSKSDLSLDPFRALDIDLSLGDVAILPGDYGVELDWQGEGYEISYANENGTLKVWSSSEPALNLGGCGGQVTVYVPEETVLERVDLNADLGEVTVENVRMQRADLTLDLGSLICTDVTVDEKLTVEADLGDVEFWGDLGGETALEASLGDVVLNLAGPASDYNCDAEVSLGELLIDGQEYGQEYRSGGRGGNALRIRADLGSVELNFDV